MAGREGNEEWEVEILRGKSWEREQKGGRAELMGMETVGWRGKYIRG